MEEVEVVDPQRDVLQHGHVQRVGVAHRPVEAQRPWPRCHELGAGDGVAAGEQRYVVTQLHQRFREPRDHPLGATVQFRGDGFG